MTLSSDEYNILNKLASEHKMDCWFMIWQDSHGDDHVYDLEEHKVISLKTGVSQLIDGCNLYDLTIDEKITLKHLLKELNILKEV